MNPPELTAVDAYFASHLLSDIWSAEEDAKRTAAVEMATQDIECEIGEFDATEPYAVAAVGEQAIYLLTNADQLMEDKNAIASESVDGAGSRSYRTAPRAHLAPRARRMIDQLTGVRPGRVETSRG